ncbi:Oligosaccharyltransferase 48 kDa subunit beta-domain-containing protein [Armillaria nabsnona]|nr:Oligosaccharyltransferase 48 kDa subunit beta-domain-containing protein [Armillaria nabsnona]
MLDPHIFTTLPPVAGKPGIYSTQFHVPDWHGMFKFVVDYKHEGWTHLHHSITVAVVPPWHDGYLHFLGAAWPYSTSIWFLFSAMWHAGDAKALTAQAHQHRLEIVSMAFGKTLFIEESFISTCVLFNEPAEIMSALSSELTQSLRVYFLPSPPRSMPLHIPKIAQAGYWFPPPITIPEELVVEAKLHKWLYLGQYLSAPLDGEDMKLSEWIELVAQTKTAYCTAVSRTLKEQKPKVSWVHVQH